MRPFYIFLLSSVLVFVVGCSTPQTIVNNAPVSESISLDLPPSSVAVVDTKFAAEATGIRLLETMGGVTWLEVPKALFAEEMSFEEANDMIGLGDGDYVTWPRETRVWFVIVHVKWLLTPLDPNQSNPQPIADEGCVFVVFSAEGASLIAAGDSVCPTH